MIFGLQALLAEYERDKIRERTVAGLKAARARGRKGGRKPKLTTTETRQLIKLYETHTLPVPDPVKRFGISKTTLHRLLKQQPTNSNTHN